MGTARGEVIRGTNRADVIVAKGGHDIVYGRGGNDTICGGPGNDRIVGGGGNDLLLGQDGRDKLYGGAARDRLLGGPANDRLAGGPGNDACLQGSGTGLRLSCERPAPVAPPPPPEPPTLVIAYSDLNNNQAFDTGDVMISKIVDTDKSGTINAGDTIIMGRYPTSPTVITPFADWRVKSHTVATVILLGPFPHLRRVTTTTGGTHTWIRTADASSDEYYESSAGGSSDIGDRYAAGDGDYVETDPASPSQPTSSLALEEPGLGDDGLIDVIFYD